MAEETITVEEPALPGTAVPKIDPPAPTDTAPASRRKRAPSGSSSSTRPKRDRPGRPSKADQLETQLTQLFTTIAGVGQVVTLANETAQRDFIIIGAQAQPLAAALVKVGQSNPAVMRVLTGMVETSAYGELLTVVIGGIVFPILANHGMLPAFIAGTIDGAEAVPVTDAPPAAA